MNPLLILPVLALAIVLRASSQFMPSLRLVRVGNIIIVRANKNIEKVLMGMAVLGVSLFLGAFLGGFVGGLFGIASGLGGYIGGTLAGFVIAIPFEYYVLKYLGRHTHTVAIG